MKYKPPGGGGGHGPLDPLDPLLVYSSTVNSMFHIELKFLLKPLSLITLNSCSNYSVNSKLIQFKGKPWQ